MPGAVWFPQYPADLGSINTRLTAVTAIFGLRILGSVRPRKWILAGPTLSAAIAFGFQFQDTPKMDSMEQRTESLVVTLPAGTHVSYTIDLGSDSRINARHFIDRAGIQKCFTISNYEPGTGQFRLRSSPEGSPLLSGCGVDLEVGDYLVRPKDLPLAQIYQPDDSDLTKLAIRNLSAGERNGRIGHPLPPPADQ